LRVHYAQQGNDMGFLIPPRRIVLPHIKSAKSFSDGMVRLHYEVVGQVSRTGAKAAEEHSRRVRT
jgi:hypothetical protein